MRWFGHGRRRGGARREEGREQDRGDGHRYGVAVLRQDNGELTEDVVILGPQDPDRTEASGRDRTPDDPSAPGRTRAVRPQRAPGVPQTHSPGEQVLHTDVVDEVLGRGDPATPAPGTLPPVDRPAQQRRRPRR
jgi:hypothetical protein